MPYFVYVSAINYYLFKLQIIYIALCRKTNLLMRVLEHNEHRSLVLMEMHCCTCNLYILIYINIYLYTVYII